jgi:Glycerol-3-phosphate responsive antiterminator (mRNA-binding)
MALGVARPLVTAEELLERITRARCCAAITVDQQLDAALASRAEVLFILRGNGLDLAPAVHRIHDAGKLVAAHLDLISGLRADRAGVAWLARSGVDAIISSHGQLMPAIKQEGAIAIQRLLLVRQNQMHAAVAAISRSGPDIVEVLPGVILPDIIHLLPKFNVPLLAGGFIRTEAEARAAVAAGAIGVTTSWPPLWDVIID